MKIFLAVWQGLKDMMSRLGTWGGQEDLDQ